MNRALPIPLQAVALLSLLLSGLSAAQPTPWAVPVGERRVAVTDSGPGADRRIILENGFLRAVVVPARGGRIESLIYKKTGREMTPPRTETQPGGLLSDQVWQQNYWHGDWNTAPYEVAPLAGAGKAELRLTGKGRLWAGITISKTITLDPDRSAVRVEYVMSSDKGVDKRLRPDFWFHNALAGTGRAFLPSPAGVLQRPLATEDDTWMYEPTAGWSAFISEAGEGVAATMEFQRLRGLHSCHAPVSTVEWVWRHVLADGMKVASPMQLGFFSGLKEVTGACDDAVIEMTLDAPAGGKAAARVKIAALADLDAKLSLTLARLDGLRRAPVDAGPVEAGVRLKADAVGAFDLALPVAGNGSFVLCGALSQGDKVIARFEKELTLGAASGVYALPPDGPREPDRGRRAYVPFDLNFNKTACKTPHVTWAKPYAGGRPNVLALVPARCEREAIELAQRFDFELTCSLLRPATELYYLLGDGFNSLKKDDIDRHLEKALLRNYDAVIIGGSWDLINPKSRERILAMARGGAGILFVGAAPAELKSTLPLESVAGMPLGPWAASPDDADAVAAALPFAVLPPVSHAAPSALRKVPDGLDDRAPRALLTAGKTVTAAVMPYGRGRIVQLATTGPLAIRTARAAESHPFPYWEYHYALLGRLLYCAAGKRTAVDLLGVDCAPEQVTVRLRNRMEGEVTAHIRLRDRFGAIVDERDGQVPLRKDGVTAFSFAPPATVAAGCHIADVIISDASGTLAWGAGAFPERKARIERWTVDKTGYLPGEKMTVTATIKGDLPPNARLRAELWDGAGRIAAAVESPAVTPDTRLVLPLDRTTTPIVEARAFLTAGGATLDQALREAWVKLPRRRDQLQTFFWGYPQAANTPSNLVGDYYRLFREMGMSANWGDKHPDNHAWAFDRLNMPFEVPATGMSWSGIKKEDAAREPDKAVQGSIGDPGIDVSHRARGIDVARTWARRNVLAYGCADENRDPPPDVCFCKICLDAFRKWLRETQYKTLEDLNREWMTAFKTWDDVMPMTQAEAKEAGAKAGSYAPWADQRQFNKWSYAGHARAFTQGVLSVDPQALVGDSGTQTSIATGARDYSLLAPAYTCMAAYSHGTQTPEQDGMAPDLIRYPWTGYNKSGPRAKNQTWMNLGGNNCGFGVFVSGSYIDPDWTLPTDGRDMQVALHEMNRGAGQMLVSARRVWDPIYLLHSMPSLHGAYITGCDELHHNSVAGFTPLAPDLGLALRSVSGAMIADGYLQTSAARVMFLSHAVALSAAECKALREWVEQGGTLIADMQPGIMTEHCRVLPKGQLDDLFGVDRRQAQLKGDAASAKAGQKPEMWELTPLNAASATDALFWPCSAVETGVRGTTALPLWTARLPGADELASVVFHRQVGKGHAWYLACNFFGQYPAVRGSTAKDPAQIPLLARFQGVFERIFAEAGIKPGAAIYLRDAATGKTGLRAPYVWTWCKDLGRNRICMLMRDFYIHDANPLDQPVTAVFDRKAHIYEALSAKYLGLGDSVELTLTDYTLRIFSLLPYRVASMALQAPAEAVAGSDVAISATLTTSGADADSHWFRVDVIGPDGRARAPYCANLEAPAGKARLRIPLALNDPAGAWRVRVQDVATGVAAEAVITIRK
jgi:hypothetical protein